MKAKIFTFSVLFFLGINACLFGQSKDLILELESELFIENAEKVSTLEYLGESVYSFDIDTLHMVHENQPNAVKVLMLLEQIMHTRDSSLSKTLEELYDEQINFFLADWGIVYKENIYAPDEVLAQYNILAGFEIVLKSLFIAKEFEDSKAKFNYYKAKMELGMEIYNSKGNDRCELTNRFKIFSPAYRELNGCRLFYGGVKFHYIDPFINELKPLFLDNLDKCEFCSPQSQESVACNIVITQKNIYNGEYNEQVSRYYYTNFDKLRECHRISMAFRYAGKNDDPVLAQFLIHKLVKEFSKEELDMYPYLDVLTVHYSNSNTSLLFEELAELERADAARHNLMLDYISVESYIEYLSKKRLRNHKLIKSLKK